MLIVSNSLMLPIVIRTRKKIFRHYTGFSFFLFIWISDLESQRERLIRHERIHFFQQLELLFIFHWLLYAYFYIISRLKGHEHYIAYRYNPFELEAYGNDSDESYLRSRKAFAWTRYIKQSAVAHQRKNFSHKKRRNIGFD